MNVINSLPGTISGGVDGRLVINKYLKIGNSERHDPYQLLLSIQGWAGNAFASIILSGYGDGGSARNHFVELMKSNAITISVSGRYFYIGYSGISRDTYYKITALLGGTPDTVEIVDNIGGD